MTRPARAVDDDARPGGDRRLERSIGNAEIAAEERVLQQRVLLGRRRLQDRDVDDRRRGLADQRRKAVLGRTGEHARLGRLAAERKQARDHAATDRRPKSAAANSSSDG